MKKIITILLTLAFAWSTNAQELDWAVVFGGPNQDYIIKTLSDSNGNVFSVGIKNGIVDLNPGIGIDLHTGGNNNDIFIQKLDSNGNFVWGKTIGASSHEEVNDLVIDNLGNLIIVGSFQNTVDFDPSVLVHNETAQQWDGFILKLDNNGNFIWVRTINSSGTNTGNSVETDLLGNIYLTGFFSQTVDFDFSTGVDSLTSAFGFKNYFLKLDTNGTFVWVKKIESNDYVYLSYSNNSLVLGGAFFGTVDFDPSANVDNYTAISGYDIFITKFDGTGNYVFTKVMGGGVSEFLEDIEQDAFGNIYSSGSIDGTIDLDPGVGVNNLSGVGSGSYFLLKLNNIGVFEWSRLIGANNNASIRGLDIDGSGNVYTTGFYSGGGFSPTPFDIDPGPNEIIVTSIGFGDCFLQKLNNNGDLVYYRTIKGLDSDNGVTIHVNNSNEIIIGGNTAGSSGGFGGGTPAMIDFNSDYCPFTLTGHGSLDPFIVKIKQNAKVWTGQTNSDWNTATNWLGGIPNSLDEIIIPNVNGLSNTYPIISTPVTTGQLTVDSNASLIINSGITLNGALRNMGTVILKDAAYLDEFTNNQCYVGHITVETIAANGFSSDLRLISSPVNTPNISEIGDDLNSPWSSGLTGADNVAVSVDCNTGSLVSGSNYGNIFELDETLMTNCITEGWVVRSSGSLENAKGYSAYLTNGSTFDFTGAPNTGNINFTVTNSGSGLTNGEGWNQIGNPYPSPISRDDVINAGLTDAMYYVASGPYQGSFSPYLPGSNIAIAQGFQVHTNSTSTITFDDSFRNTNSSTWYQNENWFEHKLEISVFGNGFADKTIVFYNNKATSDYEPLYDVVKFKSKEGQPSLSSFNNSKDLSLNGMSVNDLGNVVPVSLLPGANGNFSLSFEGIETFPTKTTIYVKDLMLDIVHNIADGNYNFASTISDNPDRFELIFIPEITFNTFNTDCDGKNGSIVLNSSIGINERAFELSTNGIQIETDNLTNLNYELEAGNYELSVMDQYGGNQNYNFTIESTQTIEAEFSISASEIQIGEILSLNNLTTNIENVFWEIDGELISNTENLSYSFNSEGIYEVIMEVSNENCTDSKSEIIKVLSKVSSINHTEFQNLSIYPNPTTGIVNLEIKEALSSIKLFDLTGKMIQTFNPENTQLDVSELNTGIYFLEVSNEEKRSIIKLIKK